MKTEQNSSDVWTNAFPRFTKFGLSVKTASLLKFIRKRKLTSALDSLVNLRPITLLKIGVRSLSLAGNPLMEESSGLASLIHWGPMIPLGLIITWFPVRIGEQFVLPKSRTGEVNLAETTAVFPFCGVVSSVPCLITSSGVRKHAQRCAPHPWQSPSRELYGALAKSLHFPQHPPQLSGQSAVL